MTTTKPSPAQGNSAPYVARRDLTFWICTGVGAALMGYGLLYLIQHPVQTVPFATGLRFGAILLLHDLVLLPIVFLTTAVILRRVRTPWKAPLRFALLVSAMVILIALWGVAGQAIDVQPGNDQVLPNHYPTSVAVLLTPVWLSCLVWGWAATRHEPRSISGADKSRP